MSNNVETLVNELKLSGDIKEYQAFLKDMFLNYMENVDTDSADRRDKVHKYRELDYLLTSFNEGV